MFKSRPVTIKAAGAADGLADGQFKALVSVFNNVDSSGDKVMPGAFAQTLADWAESGDPIPVYWSHRMDDPDYNIGVVLEAEETEAGLEVLGQLDTTDGSAKAAQVYRLMKGRRVSQFSFAYDVLSQAEGKDEATGETFNELRAVKLYEVGPTPIGANDQTELLAVKRWVDSQPELNSGGPPLHPTDYAHLFKVGRTISAKNETTLREAATALDAASKSIKSVLASLDTGSAGDDEEGKANEPSTASGTGPAKDEEPQRAKSEEPIRHTSVGTWEALVNLSTLEGEAP